MDVQSAGFWVRLIAYLVDGLLVGVPFTVIGVTFWGMAEGALYFIATSLFLYFLLVPFLTSGYTVGKYLMEIRIIKTKGGNVGLGRLVARTFIAGIIYALTLGVAIVGSIIMVVYRKDKRTIHDFIAGTQVIIKDKP